MRPRLARSALFSALLCVTFVAFDLGAQEEGKAIDLFDDQGTMSASSIAIESADGRPIVDEAEWDGSDSARVDGGITLEYERGGSSILVPAEINGIAVYFIFDTGATYTAIHTSFAKSAGIMPKSSYPVTQIYTAAGPSTARVGLIENLSLGGRSHFGVTYFTCDDCPGRSHKGKPVVGLLGMNVIGRYATSFDDSRGVIDMGLTANFDNRRRDVEPWLDFRVDKGVGSEKFIKFEGTVKNRSPRRIKNLELELRCSGGTPQTWSKGVGAFGSAKVSATLKSGNCQGGVAPEVVSARW